MKTSLMLQLCIFSLLGVSSVRAEDCPQCDAAAKQAANATLAEKLAAQVSQQSIQNLFVVGKANSDIKINGRSLINWTSGALGSAVPPQTVYRDDESKKFFYPLDLKPSSYEAAVAACAELVPAGKWVLPTEDELRGADSRNLTAAVSQAKDGKVTLPGGTDISGGSSIQIGNSGVGTINGMDPSKMNPVIERLYLEGAYWTRSLGKKDGTQKTFEFRKNKPGSPKIDEKSAKKGQARVICIGE